MATVEEVHIYLHIASTDEWIRALSIPRIDIERLTRRPLKWLRFATFTVCGAKGHLYTTQPEGGEIVDYENVSFGDLADSYYYATEDEYRLVDYKAFNDRCTSTAATPRHANFRGRICSRDVGCVITRSPSEECDAAHIIPRSKGSNYISFVVDDRSSLYEGSSLSLEHGINSIENGILLTKSLHAKFGMARIVFLKTPNFAMVPSDVPRVEEGPIPHNRMTLQYMVPPTATERGYVSQWDVAADWSRNELPPPPSILLDFMYGAAIVKRWICHPLSDMLEKRFKDDFSKVLAENPECSPPFEDESEVESDDADNKIKKDPDYELPGNKQKGRTHASADVLNAMDTMLYLSMLLKGTTPRSMVAEWERRKEEEESRSQLHSREKVQQWLNAPMIFALKNFSMSVE
ncbi:hypothetical protein V8E55_008735 [Tylopilus felleus]